MDFNRFYSGRTYAGIKAETYPKEAYKYARCFWFAAVQPDGNLVPYGNPITTNNSGIDWTYLELYLTDMITVLHVIPIVSIWIMNFDMNYDSIPMITGTAMMNFFTRLNTILESLNGEVIFLPCWEFNQNGCSEVYNNTSWLWGQGIGGCPRNWAINPSIYNSQMQMIMQAKAQVGTTRVVVGAAPDSAIGHYPYPWVNLATEPWNQWDNAYGGKSAFEYTSGTKSWSWLLGIRVADVIGISEYPYFNTVEHAPYMDDYSLLQDILGIGWNDKIYTLIDPTRTRPFLLYEWNVNVIAGEYDSRTSTTFIQNTYSLMLALMKQGINYRLLNWFIPFNTVEATTFCNNLALQYSGISPTSSKYMFTQWQDGDLSNPRQITT